MTLDRSEERVNILNNIITGIAYRSQYKFNDLTVDDISQHLWLQVLKEEDKAGHSLDLDLISRICYTEIVDLQRHNMIRNSWALQDSQPDYSVSPDNLDMFIMVKNLCEMFPPDSKEGKYIRYWATASGVKDYGIKPKGTYKGGFTESELAKLLGFSSATNRRYKRFRSHMRNFVANYFDCSD